MTENAAQLTIWEELEELRKTESVLTPISILLTTLSNLALLVYEARVLWRSRRLIPPKLLVMALASTDLIATLFGFLPLWILFELNGPSTHSPFSITRPPVGNQSETASLPRARTSSLPPVPEETTISVILSTKPVADSLLPYPVVSTLGYAMALFTLTAFWTLAQGIVVVMGVERFLALRAPFFYTARCTCVTFLLVLAVLGLVSSGVASFYLVVHLAELKEQLAVFAGFLDSQNLAHDVSTVVQGLVWTLVLLLCNWGVMRELRRMEECVTVMRMKDHSEYMKQLSMVHGAGREFARFMMAVNVVFLLSSCPNMVCVILGLCGLPPNFSLQYWSWRMSHVAALLNPFLYGFLRKSLRSRIRRFLNQHCKCLRSQRVGEMNVAGPAVARYHPNTTEQPNLTVRNANLVLRDPEASTIHMSD